MINIKPCHENLLVKLEKVEEGMVGSIYLPDKHSEQSRIGEVLGVGWGVNDYIVDEKDHFKVGDKILVPFHVGNAIHLVGHGMLDDTLRIVGHREVQAKLE